MVVVKVGRERRNILSHYDADIFHPLSFLITYTYCYFVDGFLGAPLVVQW